MTLDERLKAELGHAVELVADDPPRLRWLLDALSDIFRGVDRLPPPLPPSSLLTRGEGFPRTRRRNQ